LKKVSLYIILIALLVASCSGDKQSFSLSGKFKGLKQGEFMCFSQASEWASLDTIKVVNGEFSFSHPLTDTCVLYLQYPNFLQTQIIAIPGKSVSLDGDANNILAVKVSGDDENEMLSDFRLSTVNKKGTQLTTAAEEFIRQHPESWASIALFEMHFLQAENPDYNKIQTLLDMMIKVRPERKQLRYYELKLGALTHCKPGDKLPTFSAKALDGRSVSNESFSGKAVLITFWATSSNEFIYPVVTQRRIMKARSASIDQLNICLDADTTSCAKILRIDSIRGYNVCDGQTFNSPLVNIFGLKQLPANILVDANGIIRARDIKPEDLEATLGQFNIN